MIDRNQPLSYCTKSMKTTRILSDKRHCGLSLRPIASDRNIYYNSYLFPKKIVLAQQRWTLAKLNLLTKEDVLANINNFDKKILAEEIRFQIKCRVEFLHLVNKQLLCNTAEAYLHFVRPKQVIREKSLHQLLRVEQLLFNSYL